MTIGVFVFLAAVSLLMAGAYRTGFSAGRTDVGTAVALGFNLGLIWGFGLTCLGVIHWGTDSLVPLSIGGVFIVIVFSMVAAWPALLRRKNEIQAGLPS
jgi:hypothetical protein